jgi:septal ring factor EnvC (AmiA/AmiB activator)
MIAGIIVGLVIGVALGVVVGLLLRADHVGAARTAQARLADASAANDALQADLNSARSDAVEQQRQLAELRAAAAKLNSDLEHERKAAGERTAELVETREQLTGEFARLSSMALR